MGLGRNRVCGALDHGVGHDGDDGPAYGDHDAHAHADGRHLVEHGGGIGRVVHGGQERREGYDLAMPDMLDAQQDNAAPQHVAQPAELAGPTDAGFGSVGELIAVLIDDTALHLLFLDDGTNGSNGNGLAASNNKTSHKKSP